MIELQSGSRGEKGTWSAAVMQSSANQSFEIKTACLE